MPLTELKAEIPLGEIERVDELIQESAAAEWSLLEDVDERRAWLVGVFESELAATEGWESISGKMTRAGITFVGDVRRRRLADADWKDSYKAHFKAWKFGALNWVPVWEKESFRLPEGEQALWLDPGMAFGTGNHETTRLCCERLVRFADERGSDGRVADAGCGSGILALSAARLGFVDVEAFDNDPVAVEISESNAELNGLAGRVRFDVADLAGGLAGRQVDLLMANIQADVLSKHAGLLGSAVAPGGQMVLSGILARELAQVREAFAAACRGWTQESRVLGEWSDLVIDRPL